MEFVLKTFRTQLRVRRIANIHYFEFTPNYETREDRHAFRELVYVDSGSLIVRAENFSGRLNRNEMILHRQNEKHSLMCPKSAAPNVIIIGFECNERELDPFSQAPTRLSPALSRILAEIIKEGRQVFLPPYGVPNLADMKKRSDCQFGADQLLRNLLETFFIKLIRERDTRTRAREMRAERSPLVIEVESYLLQNYTERILLDELVFLFGTNRTTLCRAFREETGETISEYVNRLRIETAKTLIREGALSCAQIAEKLNFPSQAYFNRVFEKAEGVTPGRYRNTIKSTLSDERL